MRWLRVDVYGVANNFLSWGEIFVYSNARQRGRQGKVFDLWTVCGKIIYGVIGYIRFVHKNRVLHL